MTPEGYTLYMGKDKYENEDLIKFAWNEDIWFHVDNLSSAHVYLRLKSEEERLEDVDKSVIYQCAVLTKANSIEGNKRNTVKILYTPASNLKKTNNMEIGSVSYYNTKLVTYLPNIGKEKEIVKALNKTKVEKFPNFKQLKEEHESELLRAKNEILKAEKQKALAEKREKEKALAELEKCRDAFNDREADEDEDSEDDFL